MPFAFYIFPHLHQILKRTVQMKQKKVVLKIDGAMTFQYPLPPFLKGVVSQRGYCMWLMNKGENLRRRDIKLNRPYSKVNSETVYNQKVHQAVLDGGEFDPFTGEKLNWGLVSKERNMETESYTNDYLNTYALYPVVDHTNPEEFEFEICSLISNECKSSLTPDEFVDFCQRVVDFRGVTTPTA